MVTLDDLIQSIQTNNVDLLKALIKQISINNQDINELKDNKNRIALHYAMTQENIEIIRNENIISILLQNNVVHNHLDLPLPIVKTIFNQYFIHIYKLAKNFSIFNIFIPFCV